MGYCYDILFLLVFLFTKIIFYLCLGSIDQGTLVYFVFSIEWGCGHWNFVQGCYNVAPTGNSAVVYYPYASKLTQT